MSFTKEKKTRQRFTYEDDVILLRDFVGKNPLVNSELWEEIRNNVFVLTKKTFSVKTLRQHVNLLLEQWVEKTKEESPWIDEPYSERDHLLQEINTLVLEAKQLKNLKQQQSKTKTSNEIKTVRSDVALNLLKQNLIFIGDDLKASDEDSGEGCFTDVSQGDEDQSDIEKTEVYVEEILGDTRCETPTNIKVESSGLTTTKELMRDTQNENPTNTSIRVLDVSQINGSTSKNVQGPVRNRARKTTYFRKTRLDYLKIKKDQELEEKRLKLEERRLALEERRVAVQERNMALAEQKFQLDKDNFNKMFETQNMLLQNMISLVQNLKK